MSVPQAQLELPNLDGLEEWERRKIMSVLQRDIDIQKQKDIQIRRLRAEIHALSELIDQVNWDKYCPRCRTAFGLLVNSGAPCPKCRVRVCGSCRIQNDGYKPGWICVLCDKTQQYAVLTGEWIQPADVQPRQSSSSMLKSKPTSVLRTLNPNRENDYYPRTASAENPLVTDSSISEALLRQMKEETMQAWKPVDTAGLPPRTIPIPTKRNSKKPPSVTVPIDTSRRRSPSLEIHPPQRKSSWRRSAHDPTATHALSKGGSVLEENTANADLPVLRVEHIDDSSKETVSKESHGQKSLLNAFSRGFRCPSVPSQLNRLTDKNDGHLSSLLSVHNVRVSIRSTSSDNLSGSSTNASRERLNAKESEYDKRSLDKGDQLIGRSRSFCGRRSPVVEREVQLRKVSQNSCATVDDVTDLWDDNLSISSESESVISLGSCSVASSVRKQSPTPRKDWRGSYSTKVDVQGELMLSCNYNCIEGSLEVHVIKCKDLCPMSKKNHSNPYVKAYLLPDMSPLGKRKTRVKRKTLNPEFNEILKFTGLTKSELEARTLLITVWHYDVLGRSHFMGEIRMKMSDYPWIPGETYWIPLVAHMPDVEVGTDVSPADMAVSLKFSTTSDDGKITPGSVGSLHCVVRCPQKLPTVHGATSGYIKCYLYPDHRKTTKQKSPLVKLGADPSWKYTFVYNDLTLGELEERCLELTAWAHQRVGANEFLGGIRLNSGTGFSEGDKVDWMDSNEEETRVWRRVLSKPNSWVDGTIPLRMDMGSKM